MSKFGDIVEDIGGPVRGSMLLATGKSIFVDPEFGSDGNTGTVDEPVASVNQAYSMGRDGYGDVIYLISHLPNQASADVTSYLTETLTWAKDSLHLVGLAAPTGISPRARIAADTSQTTAIDPMLTISAHGCIFANFQVFNGIDGAVAANGVNVTGARNYFWRVHFAGIGDGQNDVAGAYSLKLTGGGEHLFEECTIGLDTSAKGTNANSEIVFASATQRNTFRRCTIRTFAEANTHQFILAGASALEGTTIFEDCTFESKLDGGGTQMSEAISINATQNGRIRLAGHTSTDAANWEASATGIVVENVVGSDPGIVVDVSP